MEQSTQSTQQTQAQQSLTPQPTITYRVDDINNVIAKLNKLTLSGIANIMNLAEAVQILTSVYQPTDSQTE